MQINFRSIVPVFAVAVATIASGDVVKLRSGASIDGKILKQTDRAVWVDIGADVVQVYAALPDAEAPSRLIGFARVDVAAGAATAFEIVVPLSRLATRDSAAKSWRPASGPHMITAARFVGDAVGRSFSSALTAG